MDLSDIDISELSFSEQFYLNFISQGNDVRKSLEVMTQSPMKYNTALLMKIIKDNEDTEYGQKYDFANIKSIEDYQNKVPITDYDSYADYIYRMTEKGEKNLLTSYDVIHYAKSSGTMGNPKRIPTTSLNQEINMKYNYAYLFNLFAEKVGLDWIKYPFLNLTELSMSKLPSGDTYGSISGKIMDVFGDMISEVTTSPIEALIPSAGTNIRYIHVRFALVNPDISFTITSFVSLFLEFLRYIKGNWELLVNDIENGTIDESIKMPSEVRESLLGKIEPMPERAGELRKIFEEGFDEPIIPKIWPRMSLLIGCGSGGFINYLEKIKEFTAPDFNFALVGLTASEGIFSLFTELNNPDAVLIPDSMFYEFLPVDANGDYSKIVTMDKLEEGKDYEIITTNLSGFYRYRMKDVVRCTGRYNNTPMIEFLYRLDQCLCLAGEKVNGEHLRAAAYKTEKDFGFDLIDFSVYVDYDSLPMKYVYLMEVEDLPEDVTREIIQEKLNENFCATDSVLRNKIEKSIIGKTELYFVQPETYLLYKELMVARGTSPAQVKPPRILRDEHDISFFNVLRDDELNQTDGLNMEEIILKSNTDDLDLLLLKIEEFLEDKGVSIKSKLKLELIIEELFVNICNYAYEKEGEIKIQYGLLKDPLRIVMNFIDEGVEFNPLNKVGPDLTLEADQRDIGGLGLTIVRKNADGIDYRYENNHNILTIEKVF
ncbi:GH3 auxin-responsive promoter family protein [Methanobrevibacter sp.]|uniref:GH3 family domain-containing protein n=1 Tax=Methanobrevibacter sp. TaxID=66852 RepID=UPI0025D059F7|nr:GH3 auxin-responsive promoter family protein [Methanobrevibacter sp.]MBQ2832429.1 GH3 auxin-responsive promoter family protein [Methanobrevibacter sp.]